MNRVELLGHLVWPVEVRREHVTGRPFAKAMIAVVRDVKGIDFVPLTLLDREAEDAARYLGEGSLVAVEGNAVQLRRSGGRPGSSGYHNQ